jgi:hypothetical protein
VSEHLDALRAVAAGTPPASAAMEAYLAKVRERAYEVTDADVDGLKDDGFSEDEILEQTVAVAVGEGFRRLDAAEAAIG